MKKLLVVFLLSILIITGCEGTMNTPTSKVEEFLSKYQKLDTKVLEELDTILKKDTSMTEEQKKEYQALLEKQYQNLSYKIKNEEINDNTATVDVEIEVLDYQSTITKAKDYYSTHQEEFKKEKKDDKDDNVSEEIKDKAEDMVEDAKNDLENIASFIDYKIKELKKVEAKTKYDITFDLNKEDGAWVIEKLSESDLQKLHGLY